MAFKLTMAVQFRDKETGEIMTTNGVMISLPNVPDDTEVTLKASAFELMWRDALYDLCAKTGHSAARYELTTSWMDTE